MKCLSATTLALLVGLAGLSEAGCGEAPPRVQIRVVLHPNAPPISSLARLRFVVFSCDQNAPAIAENLSGSGPLAAIEANVEPGLPYYIHLQGWTACTETCIPDGQANPGDCTCLDGEDPPAQKLEVEACTDWMSTSGNAAQTLTLAPTGGLCPPARLPAGDCVVSD